MFLARKVTRAKWKSGEGIGPGEIPADAVTVDLRTSGNALSFWQCGGADEGALGRVVLALAAGAQRVDKVELVWLAREELEADGISLEQSDGSTPVRCMIDQHVDAVGLDLVRLGRLAARIQGAFDQERHKLWSRGKVLEILVQGVERELVDLDLLEEKLRDEVRQAISKKGEKGRGG